MVRVKKIITALLAIWILSGIFTRVSALESVGRSEINEREAIERMADGFGRFEKSVDLSDLNIPISSLSMLFSHATKNTPYLFYVEKRLTYTYRKDTVVEVIPQYNMTQDEATAAIAFCQGEISKMAAIVRRGEGELERLILAHDLICSRFEYDLSLENNSIYKFIREGKGTCQGYAWTYMALLRKLGIECEYVASDTIEHIWLRVKIDGEWYNSDVTWDDPVVNDGMFSCISRRHLLFSDARAEMDGYINSYSVGENDCVSAKYDGVDLADVVSPGHAAGDNDHNGVVELLDLVALLQNNGECPICSDVDLDFVLAENDIDALRELILTNLRE